MVSACASKVNTNLVSIPFSTEKQLNRIAVSLGDFYSANTVAEPDSNLCSGLIAGTLVACIGKVLIEKTGQLLYVVAIHESLASTLTVVAPSNFGLIQKTIALPKMGTITFLALMM